MKFPVIPLALVNVTNGPGIFTFSIDLAVLDLAHVFVTIGPSNPSEEEVFTNEGRSMRESAAAHSHAPTLRRYAATLARLAQESGFENLSLRKQER
jgi:hypothetical protein